MNISLQDKRVSEWKQYSGRYFEDHDNICVKAYDIDPATGDIKDKDKLPFELNIAHYSYDTWAFGVVLFELCAGISLFLANSEDNILYENMLDLYAFTDKYKKKRMSEIVNVEARNLVAQVLVVVVVIVVVVVVVVTLKVLGLVQIYITISHTVPVIDAYTGPFKASTNVSSSRSSILIWEEGHQVVWRSSGVRRVPVLPKAK